MSEVLTDRNLRYHLDPHHYSNWCKVCGLYYCWHDEAKEYDVNNEYRHDGRAKGHKFEPCKEELEEEFEDDYYNDNWDEI